jgi:hypothetical protein
MAKARSFKGRFDGAVGYGVMQDGAIVYEATFKTRSLADRVAALESRKNPPEDWHATREILIKEGFSEKELEAPAPRKRRTNA